jgi:hypothetical protein
MTVSTTFGSPAAADPAAPVDVVVQEAAPPRRVVAIEWNPIALVIDRISANVEVVPVEHHALILSPFYFNTRTASFVDNAGDTLASQKFEGFGGEIGYRYYSGRGGPRGFFAGPSFILEDVTATASSGAKTTFTSYGIAADVGYAALVANDWVVSLGGGAQYDFTSQSIPSQQAPAAYYANSGVHPRILVALGYAF